jgi:cutinase
MKFSFWTLLPILGLALASPVPAPFSSRESGLTRRNTPLNTFLTLLLDYLPAIDGTIEAVVDILTAFETVLAQVTGAQTTYNELGQACTEYTVIFARGTTEPGNVGILVGPPFFEALEEVIDPSALTIQGVNDYSASIAGYLEGGDPAGSAEM